jgi:hypothetical protein
MPFPAAGTTVGFRGVLISWLPASTERDEATFQNDEVFLLHDVYKGKIQRATLHVGDYVSDADADEVEATPLLEHLTSLAAIPESAPRAMMEKAFTDAIDAWITHRLRYTENRVDATLTRVGPDHGTVFDVHAMLAGDGATNYHQIHDDIDVRGEIELRRGSTTAFVRGALHGTDRVDHRTRRGGIDMNEWDVEIQQRIAELRIDTVCSDAP